MESNENSIFEKLAGIGVHVSADRGLGVHEQYSDIEQTFIEAAATIANGTNSKILSFMLAWINVHGERVNVERLKKMMLLGKNLDSRWIHLFAYFGKSLGQSRWKLLALPAEGPLANGPASMIAARAKFRGEELWSQGSGFLIPLNSEPINAKFIMTPKQLATINRFYRNRLIYGSSWRADLITAIEAGAKTPTEAAKWVGSSYEPAHRVFEELECAGLVSRENAVNS